MHLKERTEKEFIDKIFYSLGTANYIKIFNCDDGALIDMAVNRVLEMDEMMSAFKPNSDISRLNSNSGKGFIEINPDTLKLLNRAIRFSEMSSGAFDITIRPLVELWGIGKKKNFIPPENKISEVRKLVNYKGIQVDNENCCAALKLPGQAIDLGGIAKGYAADEIKRILRKNNVESALINLGGNIITIGDRPDGKPWQVGIQNPMSTTGQHLGILSVSGKTVVTSGSNERFFIEDSIRYHHILDPKTGKPACTSLLSVTAICDCSTDADALTTALFMLGPLEGQDLLKELHAEAIFITESLEIIMTSGLKEHFQIRRSG